MAVTNYGVNANEAVKLWSRRLAREALKATYIQKFIGEGDDSVIQMRNDTKKGPGDRVRVTLRMQLTGDGIQGDGTLEGNEESLTTYTDDFLINQLRHAVRSSGKMSEQRIPFSVREEAMSGLRDWWADRWDTWFFNQICGYTVQTDTRYTGNNAVIAPSTGRKVFATGSADETVNASSSSVMTLTMIEKAVEAAKLSTPLMRPININGGKHYVMFLHPYQVYDLRTSTSTGQWLDIQKAAMSGGKVGENPIFTGALGMYNNVVLHESTRVTQGVHSTTGAAQTSTRRAVLCGAQAGVMGFGQGHSFKEYDWSEELFDYGNQLGVKAGCIGGLKKSVYNSVDFGTITVSTYAIAH
jgi:N4-gp56 family major capsid protein